MGVSSLKASLQFKFVNGEINTFIKTKRKQIDDG